MTFGWFLCKYTVANLRFYQRLFYHPRFSCWRLIGLWISLSGSSACATTVTAEMPAPSLKLLESASLQQPQPLPVDTNLGTQRDSVSLGVGLSLPTVETEILWSEGGKASADQAAIAAGSTPPLPSVYRVAQVNEAPEVERQLQQDRN